MRPLEANKHTGPKRQPAHVHSGYYAHTKHTMYVRTYVHTYIHIHEYIKKRSVQNILYFVSYLGLFKAYLLTMYACQAKQAKCIAVAG